MATIKLYNDYGHAHYEANTPRSLKTVLNHTKDGELKFEIIRGNDTWVQTTIAQWRKDNNIYEEIV